MAEKENQSEDDAPAITPETASAPEPAKAPQLEIPTAATSAASSGANPYHTDVYPENVYSEEHFYDAEGNLIGKTTTSPIAIGPDAVWIDGHPYYDVPGFGLVEWSGPGSVTEDYTMYENGNKIGIMGGEDNAPPRASAAQQSVDWSEPTGEIIDQAISKMPDRSSTPPDYKPATTPPDDPDARILP